MLICTNLLVVEIGELRIEKKVDVLVDTIFVEAEFFWFRDTPNITDIATTTPSKRVARKITIFKFKFIFSKFLSFIKSDQDNLTTRIYTEYLNYY